MIKVNKLTLFNSRKAKIGTADAKLAGFQSARLVGHLWNLVEKSHTFDQRFAASRHFFPGKGSGAKSKHNAIINNFMAVRVAN